MNVKKKERGGKKSKKKIITGLYCYEHFLDDQSSSEHALSSALKRKANSNMHAEFIKQLLHKRPIVLENPQAGSPHHALCRAISSNIFFSINIDIISSGTSSASQKMPGCSNLVKGLYQSTAFKTVTRYCRSFSAAVNIYNQKCCVGGTPRTNVHALFRLSCENKMIPNQKAS